MRALILAIEKLRKSFGHLGGVLGVMRRMKDLGMTMVVVSHEMAFAREAAERVIFMDQGEIVEAGPPGEIFTAPVQPRTREFLTSVLHRR